jgi:hypothetical protein
VNGPDLTFGAAPEWQTMSPTIGKLAAALAKAQGEMGSAKRDSDGFAPDKNGGRRYRYASIDSVRDAVRAPLAANGLTVLQTHDDDRGGPCGVCVVTTIVHGESGEWIRGRTFMPARDSSGQGYGGATTYAQRYGLLAITGCTAGDDTDAAEVPDSDAAHAANPAERSARPATVAKPTLVPSPAREPAAASPKPGPAKASAPAPMSEAEETAKAHFGPLLRACKTLEELRKVQGNARATLRGKATAAFGAWFMEAVMEAQTRIEGLAKAATS